MLSAATMPRHRKILPGFQFGLIIRRPRTIVLAMISSRALLHSRFKGFLRETAAFLVLVVSVTALPVGAQVQANGNTGQAPSSAAGRPMTGANKLTFDAASIRPSSQNFYLKGIDFLDPVANSGAPQGCLFSWNVQLAWLINFAYDLRSPQVRREAREALPARRVVCH
jgi:hypothetical protein